METRSKAAPPPPQKAAPPPARPAVKTSRKATNKVVSVHVKPPPVPEAKREEKSNTECEELFDPCTREPITNMSALEKRIIEIRKLKSKSKTLHQI